MHAQFLLSSNEPLQASALHAPLSSPGFGGDPRPGLAAERAGTHANRQRTRAGAYSVTTRGPTAATSSDQLHNETQTPLSPRSTIRRTAHQKDPFRRTRYTRPACTEPASQAGSGHDACLVRRTDPFRRIRPSLGRRVVSARPDSDREIDREQPPRRRRSAGVRRPRATAARCPRCEQVRLRVPNDQHRGGQSAAYSGVLLRPTGGDCRLRRRQRHGLDQRRMAEPPRDLLAVRQGAYRGCDSTSRSRADAADLGGRETATRGSLAGHRARSWRAATRQSGERLSGHDALKPWTCPPAAQSDLIQDAVIALGEWRRAL
ncbi:hypothetical protein C8N24_0002 [Solirubrobacter pauli]|uniref:Uncharacterized protein n=1 Tax=Solirubrobacter pauli TaxID=166793 RepID=A0A660L8G9_9ACTN|nr:hypothetical protein C8N24_0002 [Solirubrobacter pauli]